ncbi:MAG: BMP family ABC transporter substrate-binding protein [Actinomycetales bacterium]|nr:BMP family ABC transporter substrate-binding protein [Actinomycetales bacterium]
MHRKILVAGLGATALFLAACGGGSSTSTASSAAPAASSAAAAASPAAPAAPTDDSNCADPTVICVGLVTDTGKVDDKSFNQSAWEGAQAGAAAINGFSKYIETTDPKDYAANIQQFVDKGYDTVVTVGFLMGEATAAAAKANPNVNFIGVDQFNAVDAATQPNLTGLVFPEDQAGYAAGYLAGLTTKTGKIGAVLGTDTVPPVKRFGEGYQAGAKAANPNVEVTLVYHAPDNAFNDPEWGAAEAQKQLAQGADIIFGAGGNTGNGALIEIAKAKGAGDTVFCIGVDTDQYNTVPQAQKCLLTSAMKLLAEGTSDLVGMAANGSFPAGNYVGKAALADYHDTASKVPADVQQKVKDIIAGLTDGSVTTGVQ